MGGLVSRVAVADIAEPRATTIITVATPNYGAVSTAHLKALGQEVVDAIRLLSPLSKHQGIMDLTRANSLMRARRDRSWMANIIEEKRYASVPALYFHQDRGWRDYRTQMGLVAGALALGGPLLTRTLRPHDGIVTEESNDVARRSGTRWAEFDFAKYDGSSPAHVHAQHLAAMELDHISLLSSREIAGVVARLITEDDWAKLKGVDNDLRVSFAP
jgi:hypothetical protein